MSNLPEDPGPLALLSPEIKAQYRRRMELDPWYFSVYVCKRESKAERHHRPLLYLYTRQAELLCACLDDPRYDGPITRQVREDFAANGIDWRNPRHMKKVRHRLRKQDWRLPRGFGKSIFADDGDLWAVTLDPDATTSIGSKTDAFAWSRIETIGEYIKSADYAFWFPERVPDDLRQDVTMTAIRLKGRKRITPEPTIWGQGIKSQWTGTHTRRQRRDDIVGTESGEASVDDATEHLSNLDALRDETGWECDTIIGTINGEVDDYSYLMADQSYMHIVVAIETHPGGTTLENIFTDGELQLPEWFDRERVNEIKAKARLPENIHGITSLLQNFYMLANKTGIIIFTDRMIARGQFIWHLSEQLKREVILRPKRGKEDTPRRRLDDNTEAPVIADDWTMLDPLDLRHMQIPVSAFAWAGDQSTSETGDEWAQVGGFVDWESIFYILWADKGRGGKAMVENFLPFDRRAGRPPRAGLDANASQGITIDLLHLSPPHQDLARRMVPIRSNNESKDTMIRNLIVAKLESGHLYVNPRLIPFIDEMRRYRPYYADGRKKRNPVDNQLDAGWMWMTLPTVPPSPRQVELSRRQGLLAQHQMAGHIDPVTGMDLSDWSRDVQ